MGETTNPEDYFLPNGEIDYSKILSEDEYEFMKQTEELGRKIESGYFDAFAPVLSADIDAKIESGEYIPVKAEEEIEKKIKGVERPVGDVLTYIFYYPLKSIIGILKSIMGIFKVISILAFFGGCFCLYMHFSKNPEEWYYQLWFGIVLIAAPFVASAIYFVLEQVQLKLLKRLAKNKHVMTHLNMS